MKHGLYKYSIHYRYKGRAMEDWAYGETSASVIRTFRRNHLRPQDFTHITARRIK